MFKRFVVVCNENDREVNRLLEEGYVVVNMTAAGYSSSSGINSKTVCYVYLEKR